MKYVCCLAYFPNYILIIINLAAHLSIKPLLSSTELLNVMLENV
jgi:hypothetical protein